jgi:hypothetical protein
MIEVSGIATYTDGTVVPYTATQREFGAWERYAFRAGLPVQQAQITMARFLAYAAITRGDDDPISFEAFDATVAEVTASEDPATLDPTLPARSTD